MRLVTYEHGGRGSFGVLVATAGGDAVIDAAGLVAGCHSILDVLAADGLSALREASADRTPDLALAEVTLLPVVPNPGKILCVGVNYRSHLEEAGRAEQGKPTVFLRFADSQLGAGQDVQIAREVSKFDYEGEVAVVVGRAGRRIPADRAAEHIAGYACYNDFSARDWQRHSGQWTPGKNFPGSGAFGPWLLTADEVADPKALVLQTLVNGDVRQHASLADLIFSIPELIAYLSTFTALAPGDVIVTGTPGGVGLFRDPPSFLNPGDVVEVRVDGMGSLVNAMVAERGDDGKLVPRARDPDAPARRAG